MKYVKPDLNPFNPAMQRLIHETNRFTSQIIRYSDHLKKSTNNDHHLFVINEYAKSICSEVDKFYSFQKENSQAIQSELTKLMSEIRGLTDQLAESRKSHTDDLVELMRLREENESLKTWKKEAILVYKPLLDWGQNESNLKVGSSIAKEALKRCKEHEQLTAQLSKAKELLKKAHDLASMGVYFWIKKEIEQFLNETVLGPKNY